MADHTKNNIRALGLPEAQLSNVYDTSTSIIDNLPPEAVDELLKGNGRDLDNLFDDILWSTHQVLNNNASNIGIFSGLSNFEKSFDESLKILSYNYFKTTMLPNFQQNSRNIEWSNLVQMYGWSCFLASRGSGKCFSPETKVLMFDGTSKEIKDIKIGDLIMGVDNTPRTVLELHSGIDDMYEIEQKHFKNYVVNSKHDMYFKMWHRVKHLSKNDVISYGNVFDEKLAHDVIIEAKDLYNQNKTYFRNSFGVGVNGWDLPEKILLIEPYFLGYWLGDGCKRNTSITTISSEVIEYLYEYANRLGMKVTHVDNSINYYLSKTDKHLLNNILRDRLRGYNVLHNKHIPDDYLYSSRKQRLELLAGLIDSDRTNPKKYKNAFVFCQKNRLFTENVQKLCWSLGFRANIKEYFSNIPYGDITYYKLQISGNLSQVPCKILKKKKNNIDNIFIKSPQRRKFLIKYLGKGEYCGFTCNKDHLFLLEDGTIVRNSMEFAMALPTWRLWRYRKPTYFQRSTIDNRNSKETVLITNEARLGRRHLAKIVGEIESNELLHPVLLPDSKRDGLGKEKIVGKNGASLELRSLGSFIRGLHVGFVIVDDYLDKSSLYSQEQRDRAIEVFDAEIKSIVEQHGGLIVDGTPFHAMDLYGHLKKDPAFKVFEYPAIDINGNLLAPDRYNFKQLMNLKHSLGTIIFSREYLITPISDASSIFPYEYLKTSLIGTENISLVDNIESFPIKMKRVVVGIDFAKSANVGADFTVLTCWGKDINNGYWLINIERGQGWSHNEQVSKILRFNHAYRPNKIKAEDNGFQSIIIDMVKERGVKNIDGQTTTENKKDDLIGLPAIVAMFERGEIHIPSKEGRSRDMANLILGEFNSIGYVDKGKLQSIEGHDDIAISCWEALMELKQKTGLKIEMLG